MMQETTLTMLNTYCERSGDSGLIAEPINAITNIAFIIAAVLAARSLRKQRDCSFRRVGDLWLLIAALFSIGIGSTLWHVYATHSTLLADVLPITVFINIFLLSSLRRLLNLSWLLTAGCWGMYATATLAAQVFLSPNILNGSVMYLPAYLTLVTVMIALILRNSPAAMPFAHVVLLFSISLILRTVDLMLCPIFPIGTHFLWHLLNAVVVYRLLMVLVVSRNRP